MSTTEKTEPSPIFEDSPDAAHQVTITAWVSAKGGTPWLSEDRARQDGATHVWCRKCGKVPVKKDAWRSLCPECFSLVREEKWKATAVKQEWDGTTDMVWSETTGEYFRGYDEVIYHCRDAKVTVEELCLYHTVRRYAHEIDTSLWEEDLPEGGEAPDWLTEAIDAFNKIVNEKETGDEPLSWYPDTDRAVLLPEAVLQELERLCAEEEKFVTDILRGRIPIPERQE